MILGWKTTQLAEYSWHWKGSCPGSVTVHGKIGFGGMTDFNITGSDPSVSPPISNSKVLRDAWWWTSIKLSTILKAKRPLASRHKIWVLRVVWRVLQKLI